MRTRTWLLAGMLAVLSLGGLLFPAIYARETPAWLFQARGQDWFDLLIVTPWLVACGVLARPASYRWRVLLAGTYAYVVYELLIYAFGIHFNSLFLVYCATLGVAAFSLIAILGELARERHGVDRHGGRVGGLYLVATGVLFALLWLADIVPAMLRGQPSPALAETGLFTNPVHVIDLSFVLPLYVVVGIALWNRRQLGEVYGPVLLAFGVVMAASIAGLMVSIGVTMALALVAAGSAGVLARVLYPQHVRAFAAIHEG